MSLRPLLIVVSAPSGGGKTTLCDRLMSSYDWIRYSVSCTTRLPRGKEVNGVDYEFVTADAFEQYVRDDDFLEHADVHGFKYGTRRLPVLETLESGFSILMDIDVQGAAQIREALQREGGLLQKAFLDIFIEPPSLEILRQRLSDRDEDAPDVIQKRLVNAAEEMKHAHLYTHRVVNTDLDESFAHFENVVLNEAHDSSRE